MGEPGSIEVTRQDAGATWSALVRRATLALATLAFATLVLAARADAFVYWANINTGTIGRADLNGSGANQSLISGASGPVGIAVNSAHVYWTNFAINTIGRADLGGSNTNQSFLTGANGPSGVAVGPLGKATAKRTQKQKRKRIRIRVNLTAEEDLTAKARGKIKINPTYKLKPKAAEVAAGQTETLKLKPKRRAGAKIFTALNAGGTAVARPRVKLTDGSGNVVSERLSVKLRR